MRLGASLTRTKCASISFSGHIVSGSKHSKEFLPTATSGNAMRKLPTLEQEGYQLDDGEKRHLEAPETFHLPPRSAREGLGRGDIAKLMFDIVIDGDIENVALERMWVIVKDCVMGVYSGSLDNKPVCSDEGKIKLALGDTVYFGPEHVVMFYTVAEMEKLEAERKQFIEQTTYEDAVEIQKRCEDREKLHEMLQHGVPIMEVLEKFDLAFPREG